MMDSPFNDIDDAFRPFYTDTVKIVLKSGERYTVDACVLGFSDADSLLEGSMDSEIQDFTVNIAQGDAPIAKRITRGDVMEVAGERARFVVESCYEDLFMGWTVKARKESPANG